MNLVSVEGRLDGRENMSRDAALLSAGRLSCRVYGWNGPWVTLGRFQKPDADLLPHCPVPFVMRPTGGKAVLHGHDVTVGLAMPLLAGETRNLRQAYRRAIAPLVAALRDCGMPAVLAGDLGLDERTRSADCFAGAAPNDVVHEILRVKVCGCALRFTRGALLLQASIPAGWPLVDPALVFAHPHVPFVGAWDAEAFAAKLDEALFRQLSVGVDEGREYPVGAEALGHL